MPRKSATEVKIDFLVRGVVIVEVKAIPSAVVPEEFPVIVNTSSPASKLPVPSVHV